MNLRVFAVCAHPDDIEFMMSGTLLHLADAGADIHYMNVASGSAGSMTLPPAETARIRRLESIAAADMLGATYHESIAPDLEIFYTDDLIRRLCAVIRTISPQCIIAPSPIDYMEDHQNTARIAATAAFSRGIPNYATIPEVAAIAGDLALYHAMPYGLEGPLGERPEPEFVVDVTEVGEGRRRLLEAHASQRDWLDASQGVGSYVEAMFAMSANMAMRAGIEGHAEGFRRRLHLGYCDESYRPLEEILGDKVRLI